jgi:ADP-ribose pyrophosphatase YjhB (NUDIX family)
MVEFEIDWKGEKYTLEWFDGKYSGTEKPTGCQGFIFDDSGKLCIVKTKSNDYWQLPGGGVEDYDNTILDTFLREIEEEVDLDLKGIKELGYVTGIKKTDSGNKKTIQIKYVALVAKVKTQTIDVAEGSINERLFIEPKDFNKYFNWGESGDFQIKKATEAMK